MKDANPTVKKLIGDLRLLRDLGLLSDDNIRELVRDAAQECKHV